jgi:hypothetical protein
MVERKIELRRRRTRHKKMNKYKALLARAKSPHDREALVKKIQRISPWWKEPVAVK